MPFSVQILEALDRNEPVDLLQMRTQLRGDVEIVVAVVRPDFEDDGDHGGPLFDAAQERALLGEDETLFLGELEVRQPVCVLTRRARYAS